MEKVALGLNGQSYCTAQCPLLRAKRLWQPGGARIDLLRGRAGSHGPAWNGTKTAPLGAERLAQMPLRDLAIRTRDTSAGEWRILVTDAKRSVVRRKSANAGLAADAVAVEPVSASKFPDMRESAGNFCNLQGTWP